MTWTIKPQEHRGELVLVKPIRLVPAGTNGDGEPSFMGVSPAIWKMLVVHDSGAIVTVTRKGKTYTVKNPDRKIVQSSTLPSGRRLVAWNAPTVVVPGDSHKFWDKIVFLRYVKQRFGALGETIANIFDPISIT